LLSFPVLLSLIGVAHADDLEKRIEWLLKKVETSDCIFMRNNVEHSGKDAAKHVRKKYEHFKKKGKIKSVEDFVNYSAAKSMITGKPYLLKNGKGEIIKVKDWLLDKYKKEYPKAEGG
jgi:hypothetical protein